MVQYHYEPTFAKKQAGECLFRNRFGCDDTVVVVMMTSCQPNREGMCSVQ